MKKLPFAILKPVKAPVNPEQIYVNLAASDLIEFFEGHDYGTDVMVLDIETKGNKAADPASVVVGFGLADRRGAAYWTAEHWPLFLNLASKHTPQFIGHNIFFDASYALRDGSWLNWTYCTYGLYKQLATEGWIGQRWSLKSAQVDLLGWEQTNEGDLNKWLIENNYHTSSRKTLDGVASSQDWAYIGEKDMYVKADKSEMWRAPAEILGKYCALDCYSTYALFMLVLKPALDKFHVLHRFHKEEFITLVKILCEQMLSGFVVDVDGLKKYEQLLEENLANAQASFFVDPVVQPYIEEYNHAIVAEHLEKEPEKYKKQKQTVEPPKFTKQGIPTKRWLAWKEEQDNPPEPEVTVRWENWEQKRRELVSTNHFNPASNKQLSWLFYEKLGYEAILFTQTGAPATDNKALMQWGEAGKLLVKASKISKELGYVKGAIDFQRDGIIHPQFRVPGTLTGRLSGAGDFNVQQQPKTKDYLSLFKARPGHVWVDFDWTALEPSVLTELSRDKAMLKLYGPGVKPNDIYIFVGSAIPGIKETFTACGYHPDNPTKEAISKIKKEHKILRNICKVLALSAQYGAGPKKIRQSLALQGIHKTLDEVEVVHKAYWQLFSGIKEYEQFLKKMWRKNEGWVLNGIGRPIGIDVIKEKDLVNSVVQSTGHDLHMMGLRVLKELLDARKIPYRWVIADFHDEAILETVDGRQDEVIACFREMETCLNDKLQPYVPLKIDPAIGTCLADFKISE